MTKNQVCARPTRLATCMVVARYFLPSRKHVPIAIGLRPTEHHVLPQFPANAFQPRAQHSPAQTQHNWRRSFSVAASKQKPWQAGRGCFPEAGGISFSERKEASGRAGLLLRTAAVYFATAPVPSTPIVKRREREEGRGGGGPSESNPGAAARARPHFQPRRCRTGASRDAVPGKFLESGLCVSRRRRRPRAARPTPSPPLPALTLGAPETSPSRPPPLPIQWVARGEQASSSCGGSFLQRLRRKAKQSGLQQRIRRRPPPPPFACMSAAAPACLPAATVCWLCLFGATASHESFLPSLVAE